MELSIVIFSLALLIPGLWLIFAVGREYRQRTGLNDQLRLEQERAAYLSALRRARPRSAARPSPPTAEPFAQAPGGAQETDSWQDLTASHLSTAFESFQHTTPQSPSEQFIVPQLNEAFEKFMGER